MKPTSMKNRSLNSTKKRCSKQSPKNQNILQNWLPNGSRKVIVFWGKRGAKVWMGSFVAQTVFVIEKWAPSPPKVHSKIERWAKNEPKSPPIVKKSSKSQTYSSLPATADRDLPSLAVCLDSSRRRNKKGPGTLRETLTISITSIDSLINALINGHWGPYNSSQSGLIWLEENESSGWGSCTMCWQLWGFSNEPHGED